MSAPDRAALLARQVVQLVKTEQRLHRTERAAQLAVRRTETLNRFALAVAGVHDRRAILEEALRALFTLYPYEQGLALVAGPDGSHALLTALYSPPRDADADVLATPLATAVTRLGAEAPVPTAPTAADAVTAGSDPSLSAALATLRNVFGPASALDASHASEAVLVVPVGRPDGRVAALLLLRKLPMPISHLERLPDRDDTTFLTLAAHHVEVALAVADQARARVQAEIDLARSEARLRAILEQSPDAVVVSGDDDVVIYANPIAARMLGYADAGALLGRRTPELHAAADRAAVAADPHRPSEVRVAERRLVRRDGSTVDAELTTLRIELDGRPAALTIAKDLSERRAIRAQLAQSERLASVGALAAGVAHEINNPLAFVMLHLEALASGIGDPALAGRARTAHEGCVRIREIVRDLKAFARVDDGVDEPVRLSHVVEGVRTMTAHELRHRARLELDVDPTAIVIGNEGRLAQVLLNLVVNAAQAIPEGAVDENAVRIEVRRVGAEVVLVVSDTGCGIAPADLDRLFEPFFTTKEAGGGLGLGLPISRNIVLAYGGRLEVESRVGSGSRFTVVLPAASRAGPVHHHHRRPATAPPTGLRVLVVDDEPAILAAVAASLEECEVVRARSGREARARLEEDRRFDAILCDVMMPDVDGVELHAWLTAADPTLAARVVFMSGGSSTPRTREFLARGTNPVLAKPFTVAELGAALAMPSAAGPPSPRASRRSSTSG